MITFSNTRVYIAIGPIDMRKAIDGLSALVANMFQEDVFGGHLFVFSNRKRSMIKILYWHNNGFWLLQKRLEKGKIRWPQNAEAVMQVGQRELMWLLDGLEINQAKAHRSLSYSHVY